MKLFLIIILGVFISLPVFAVQLTNPLGDNITTIPQLIMAIVAFVRIIAYGIAPIAIIIAAYFFLASGGDPGKATTAKNIVIWTLIGVLIITTAAWIVDLLATQIWS